MKAKKRIYEIKMNAHGFKAPRVQVMIDGQKIITQPQYPLLFGQWKGRMRAISFISNYSVYPKKQPASMWTSIIRPRCSNVKFACLLGGTRWQRGMTDKLMGRPVRSKKTKICGHRRMVGNR